MTSPMSGAGPGRDQAYGRGPWLAAAAVELSAVVNALAVTSLTGGRTPGFRRLGVGAEQIERNLATAVEPVTRRSVWSIQPIIHFDPVDISRTTNARSVERGLSMLTITLDESPAAWARYRAPVGPTIAPPTPTARL